MDGPARFDADFAYLDDYFTYPNHTVQNRGRRNVTTYDFMFRRELSIIIEEDGSQEIIEQVRGAFAFVSARHPNMRYRIILQASGAADLIGLGQHSFGTPFQDNPMGDFENRFNMAAQTYDVDSFDVYNHLIIEVTPDAQNIAVRSGHSQILATHDWLLISPNSRVNCAPTALAICKGWFDNVKLLDQVTTQNQAGSDMKRRHQAAGRTQASKFTTLEDIEFYAKKFQCNITVYDNVFKVFKTFLNGDGSSHYRIQNRNGHMWAMLPREAVAERHPDFKMPAFSNEIVPQEHEKPMTRIVQSWLRKYRGLQLMDAEREPPPEEEQERRMAAWDIEAYKDDAGNFVPYMVGLAFSDVYGENNTVMTWQGEDCLDDFIEYLTENAADFDEYTFYAHNGAKFDLPLLLKYNLLTKKQKLKISSDGFIVQDGAVTSMTLKRGDITMVFRDSLRLLMGSLDALTVEFDVEHKKLTGAVDHDKITAETWRDHSATITEYLEHDCLGLLEVMQKFSEAVFGQLKINITKCISAASMAKKNFFRNYYLPYTNPIFNLSRTYDRYIRRGYFGGRVEAFHIGEVRADVDGPLYYFDFTSLYPDQGRKKMPYGKPSAVVGANAKNIVFNKDGTIRDQFFGFCEVMVTGPIDYDPKRDLPVHGCVCDGKLVFPILTEPRLMVLGSEEMKYARNMGIRYEYDVKSVATFNGDTYMKQVYEDAFERKAQAARDGNPALTNTNKIVANSTYGVWGFKYKDRDQVILGSNQAEMDARLEQKLSEGRLVTWANHANYTMLRVTDDVDIEDFNVSIASFTTMYSRMRIHNLMVDIKRKGKKIYYCDTDSIITNCNVMEHADLRKEYMWDGCGEDLGSLKNECHAMIKKTLKKRKMDAGLLQQEETADGGQLSFDRVIINGCKNYCLWRKYRVAQLPDIFKEVLKGIRKNAPISGYALKWSGKDTQWHKYDPPQSLRIEHYEILARGGAIMQDQIQFRSGNQHLLRESEKGGVQMVSLTKSVKRLYTKGIVSVFGDVTPLRLAQKDFANTDRLTKDWVEPINLRNIQYAKAPVTNKRKKYQDEVQAQKDASEYSALIETLQGYVQHAEDTDMEDADNDDDVEASGTIEEFMEEPAAKKRRISL